MGRNTRCSKPERSSTASSFWFSHRTSVPTSTVTTFGSNPSAVMRTTPGCSARLPDGGTTPNATYAPSTDAATRTASCFPFCMADPLVLPLSAFLRPTSFSSTSGLPAARSRAWVRAVPNRRPGQSLPRTRPGIAVLGASLSRAPLLPAPRSANRHLPVQAVYHAAQRRETGPLRLHGQPILTPAVAAPLTMGQYSSLAIKRQRASGHAHEMMVGFPSPTPYLALPHHAQ
jgi:hypothetical protein